MGEWIDRLIGRTTVNCFYCNKTVDKKTVYDIKLNTGDGLHILKACAECADDVNDVLKAIEEVKHDSPV
tara:strand:+ start:898 stop:1104 length:207 start_codon:yes stop_codon:yes gene_type:complete